MRTIIFVNFVSDAVKHTSHSLICMFLQLRMSRFVSSFSFYLPVVWLIYKWSPRARLLNL